MEKDLVKRLPLKRGERSRGWIGWVFEPRIVNVTVAAVVVKTSVQIVGSKAGRVSGGNVVSYLHRIYYR